MTLLPFDDGNIYTVFKALSLVLLLSSSLALATFDVNSACVRALKRLSDTQPTTFNNWYPLHPVAGKKYSVGGDTLFQSNPKWKRYAPNHPAENRLIVVTAVRDGEVRLRELRTNLDFSATSSDWYDTPMRPAPNDFRKLEGRMIWFGGSNAEHNDDMREYPSATTGRLVTALGSVGVVTKLLTNHRAIVDFPTAEPAKESVIVPVEDLHFFSGGPEDTAKRLEEFTSSLSEYKFLSNGATVFVPTRFGNRPATFVRRMMEGADGTSAVIKFDDGTNSRVSLGEILLAPNRGSFTGVFSFDKEGQRVDFDNDGSRQFLAAAATLVSQPEFRRASDEVRFEQIARFVKSLMAYDTSASFEPLEEVNRPPNPLVYNLACSAGVCRHFGPMVAQVLTLAGYQPELKKNKVHVWTTVQSASGKNLILDATNFKDNLIVDEATTKDERYVTPDVVRPK